MATFILTVGAIKPTSPTSVEPPVYTRPAEYHPVESPEDTWTVPEILLSGHEAKIKEWEYEQALARTKALRPDLLQE